MLRAGIKKEAFSRGEDLFQYYLKIIDYLFTPKALRVSISILPIGRLLSLWNLTIAALVLAPI